MCRQFVAGAWFAGGGGIIWNQIVIESGSANAEIGGLAANRTARELRVLLASGWRVMSHLVLRTSDIDHVAIGPGGLVVVETRWRSHEHAFGAKLERFDFDRLRRAADDVQSMLRARFQGSPTRRVVVLWEPVSRDEAAFRYAPDDVIVVRGTQLGDWLNSIPDAGVTPDLIESD